MLDEARTQRYCPLTENMGGRRDNGPAPAPGGVLLKHRKRTAHHGIRLRHRAECASHTGRDCSCSPAYEAWAYSPRERRKIRRSFPTLAAAKAWRADAQVAIRRGQLRAPTQTTLIDAAEAWLEGAKAGLIRTRSGDGYKPSALRGYEKALRDRILPAFGGSRLAQIDRLDLQDFADRLLAEGLSASTIRNVVMPLRVIYRRALSRGDVAVNPTAGLELPAVRDRRERVASPVEAAALIEAAPPGDRALWAAALYAGLRRGELQALRWEEVDLQAGVICVERSWDDKSRLCVEPKSRAGRRSVPIAAVLRQHLLGHRLRSGRSEGLVFGRSGVEPFVASTVWRRARTAWKRRDLRPISFHEARHTFASLMIAAGVNAKALSTYMGHASVTTTHDRYGHLMPGNEVEAAGLLDGYLILAAAKEG